MTDRHLTAAGRRLAFDHLPGQGTTVVFLHGFRSDRSGTKALAIEAWCRAAGRPMLRFDLAGHGDSGPDYDAYGVTDWLEDAGDIIAARVSGPAILVGSSLGGWLALLLARAQPARWAGIVTIAAAADFTARMQRGMTEAERAQLQAQGALSRPSEYGDDYLFSQVLFDQGARNTVLDSPLHLPMPVRMLQGTADADVPMADALALLGHATGPDIRLTLVKDADHRFSDPPQLALIAAALDELS